MFRLSHTTVCCTRCGVHMAHHLIKCAPPSVWALMGHPFGPYPMWFGLGLALQPMSQKSCTSSPLPCLEFSGNCKRVPVSSYFLQTVLEIQFKENFWTVCVTTWAHCPHEIVCFGSCIHTSFLMSGRRLASQ